MGAIALNKFLGVVTATHPLMLPDSVGQAGQNMRPGFSDLRPWFQPTQLALAAGTVPAGTYSIYRWGADSTDPLHYWCAFPGDVDCVRSLVGNDTAEKTYYTDGSLPKWFNSVFGFGSPPYPNNVRTLGVPQPTVAPTITVSGGSSSATEARVYIFTYVTDQGEESAPSPPSAVTSLHPVDATWTFTNNQATPTYNGVLDHINIYRSATTTSGSAVYLYVGSMSSLSSGATYPDTVPDTSLGSACESLNWQMPVANMIGLTSMWDGMMAGFFDKTLCFCYPFVPYAWPTIYQQTIPENIVGLCVWQQNLVVLTDGKPYALTGTDPTTLTMVPIDSDYACVSKRSICEIPGGCVWAAPDGLAYAGTRGADIVSDLVLTREQWQALNPPSMVVDRWGSFIIIRYNNGTNGCLVFDWEKANAVYPNKLKVKEMYPCTTQFDNAYYDKLTGNTYLLNTTAQTISEWDASSTYETVTFTSKIFRQPAPTLFLWCQVRADVYPVSLGVSVDGTQYLSSFAVYSQTPVKLPIAGFKGRDWVLSVTANGPVQEVVLADSIDDLKKTE